MGEWTAREYIGDRLPCGVTRPVTAWAETVALFVALYSGVPLGGLALDRAFGWPPLPEASRAAGIALLLVGASGVAWCFVLLVRVGHGTPNPALPTKSLVTSGPFGWTRNPVMASHFVAGVGVSLLVASPGATAIILALTLPSYALARHEERVLEARFGDAYRAYRASVPRFVPRPPRRQSR